MNGKTAKCSICGNETPHLGTQMCNRCWELNRTLESLLHDNPDAAIAWLLRRIDVAVVVATKLRASRARYTFSAPSDWTPPPIPWKLPDKNKPPRK